MRKIGYVFNDTVSRESTVELLNRLRNQAQMPVYVSSLGGTFDFFSVLAPTLRRSGMITVSGVVCSAAIILFLLGQRRQAFPNAIFFFHEVRTLVQPSGAISIAEAEEVEEYAQWLAEEEQENFQYWLSSMREAQAWFVDFISRETGVPTGTFLNLMRSEATLSARDALRYNIIHEIVPEGYYD